VRDAFISKSARTLADLRPGARLGTASLRRGAQVRRLRPDIEIALLRGNVETRLRRIEEGAFDATLLALAGLKRLGLADCAASVLETQDFLPAVGQGAVGITARTQDARTLDALAPILCADTGVALAAERAFLAVLDGSCRTPIAGHAILTGDALHLRGLIAKPDGAQVITVERRGAATDAAALGRDAGQELLRRGGPGFLST